MQEDMYWVSPTALRWYPRQTVWLLENYLFFLHRGEWPPRPSANGLPSPGKVSGGRRSSHAPFEVVSGVAAELMLRVNAQGRGGDALLLHYGFGFPIRRVSRIMKWTEAGVWDRMAQALKGVYHWGEDIP